MSEQNWFQLVKTAINDHIAKRDLSCKMLEAKSKVVLETSKYEHPDLDLDNLLRTEYCEIKYCDEDWLGSLQNNDLYTVTHSCHMFLNDRCHNVNCPVYIANNAYFDAQSKYEAAKKKHSDSVNRVFGIKTK